MFRALGQRFNRWAILVRSSADSVWNRLFLRWLLIVGFSCLFLYWSWHIPSPGKTSAVLAVIAVVITFQAIGGLEKFTWMMVLFAFLFLELTAIDRDREKFEKDRHEARVEERQSFGEIGEGIERTLGQLRSTSIPSSFPSSSFSFAMETPLALQSFGFWIVAKSAGTAALERWYVRREKQVLAVQAVRILLSGAT